MGYFEEGLPATLIRILLLAGVLACVATKWLFPAGVLRAEHLSDHRAIFPLGILAAALSFFCGVTTLTKSAINSSRIGIFAGLFLIAATLFFLFSALSPLPRFRNRVSTMLPYLIVAVLAALLLLLASAYFDMTVNINGPFAPITLFSLLACALFLLCEMRLLIGRPAPRAHLAVSLGALVLSLPCAIGNLLFCFFGDTGAAQTIAEPAFPLTLMAMILYIFTRLLTFCISKSPVSTDKNQKNS